MLKQGVEEKGSGSPGAEQLMGLRLEGFGRLEGTGGICQVVDPQGTFGVPVFCSGGEGKGTYPHSINPLTFTFFFQSRSGAGWKRVLRSLCHSRTRVPLLAAIYFLMVHVLLILCFTGHL